MDYMLKRWTVFIRFLDDGRICLSNNAAERALRGIAMAGSLCTPVRAAKLRAAPGFQPGWPRQRTSSGKAGMIGCPEMRSRSPK
jgi:Transposase IS66 family